MLATALTESLKAAGARIGTYRGAETASSFGDVTQEFACLAGGCGVVDLGWRTKMLIAGPDRQKWLNGMITNNIRDLAPGHGSYNFLLNAQGHILGDMYVYNRGDYLLLDTDACQAENIRTLLEKFIIMDDVEITDATDRLTAVGVIGPKAIDVLSAVGLPIAQVAPLQVEDGVWHDAGVSVVKGEHGGFEIWMAPANAVAIWTALVNAGATPVGTDAVEIWRVARGIPQYRKDIRERDLPQETEQMRALNFAKGCYVGQEIVERIRSRGAVHRHFTGFEIDDAESLTGAKVQANGKDVGEITSVAKLPGGRAVALGYIRREAGPPGTSVTVGGTNARIAELPFSFEPVLKN